MIDFAIVLLIVAVVEAWGGYWFNAGLLSAIACLILFLCLGNPDD